MSDRNERTAALRAALEELGIEDELRQKAEAHLHALLDAQDAAGAMAIDNESRRQIAAEAFGWPLAEVIRREYGSPDGTAQGKFFCQQADQRKVLRRDPAFWVEYVLPQMYATRRPDLFDLIGGLPEDDWLVGGPDG